MRPSLNITAEEIETGFKNNAYRSGISSISTWSNQDRNVVVSKQKEVSAQTVEDLSAQLHARISDEYASLFDLSKITLKDGLKKYEYDQVFEKLENAEPQNPTVVSADFKDLEKIGTKWIRGMKEGTHSVSDIKTFLNPLQIDKEKD